MSHLETKPEKVIRQLRDNKIAIFKINALTRNGREELMEIISSVYTEMDLKMEFLFNVYSAVVEVIFNGIKANAKYLMFQQEIRGRIKKTSIVQKDDPDDLLRGVLQNDALREFLNRFIIPDKIRKQTMNILKLDEKYRTGKTLSKEDQELLKEFKTRLAETDITIHFTIALSNSSIVFSVVNESPIMKRDLERINKSRQMHYSLSLEGKSNEYFREDYLDSTESAGMGIAMADEVYFEMGLNPLDFFTINTESAQTRAVLRFPLELLKNNLTEAN